MRTLAIAALLLLVAVPVCAQVDIDKRAPERTPRPEIVPPGMHDQVTRPPGADAYPEPPRVEHDPAFIQPFAKEYRTPTTSGWVGLSGWTSPNTPVGPGVVGYHEVPGWLAIGFSFSWGGPPATPVPAQRPAEE